MNEFEDMRSCCSLTVSSISSTVFAFKPCLHHSGENLNAQQSPLILDFCLRKTQSVKYRDYRDFIDFEKLNFQNASRLQQNAGADPGFLLGGGAPLRNNLRSCPLSLPTKRK